ncbi:MAG: GTP cyclohydrolase I FolE2 [Acidobacteria bacterium]|nr:MAG: GTP cyclohydrolase I FolE2 [Acidobacteriota bacterium]
MKDIQSQFDSRRINIDKVGVKGVSYPITLRDKSRKNQHTVGTANMYVNLPHKFKGTHMSRFVEILNEFHGQVDINNFATILERMKERLDAEASHLELRFPYFFSREKDGKYSRGGGDYQCTLYGSLGSSSDLVLKIEVPVAACYDRLSGYPGRWGQVELRVRFARFLWIEDLITLVESAVERAQNEILQQDAGRLGVELVARTVAERLEIVDAIDWFAVEVHNFCDECLAFASVESSLV